MVDSNFGIQLGDDSKQVMRALGDVEERGEIQKHIRARRLTLKAQVNFAQSSVCGRED